MLLISKGVIKGIGVIYAPVRLPSLLLYTAIIIHVGCVWTWISEDPAFSELPLPLVRLVYCKRVRILSLSFGAGILLGFDRPLF